MQQLSNKQIKKHQTNIKSAVGAFGMTLIMTLVYLVKALLGHNFHFYFCNFVPEVLLKSASFTSAWSGNFSAVFTQQWQGKLSLGWFLGLFAVYAAVCVALVVLAGKHPPLIWVIVEKPTIGDAHRAVECDDIARANRLLYATAILGLLVCLLLGRWLGIPNTMEETMLIDLIFHVLVLLFLLVGGISAVVLPKDKRGDPREDMKDFIVKMED